MTLYVNKLLLKMCFIVSLVASVFFVATAASAQTSPLGDMIEVAFNIPENSDVQSFNAEGCSYIAVSLTGAELTLKCPLNQIYKVGFTQSGQSDVQTRYGSLQIRPDLDGRTPLVGALHYVGNYAPDYNSSLQNYNDLPKALQPLLLANVADAIMSLTGDVPKVAGISEAADVPKATDVRVAQAPTAIEEPAPPEVSPASETPTVPGIDLSWDASYGSIRLNGSKLLEELQEADGLIQGRLALTKDIGNLFILSSDRNPNCNKSFTVEQLEEAQEVFFECTEYTVSVPFKLPLAGNECQGFDEKEISCLVANRKKSVQGKD